MTARGFWIAQLAWWGSYVVISELASVPGLIDATLYGHLYHVGQKLAKAGVGLACSLLLYALFVRLVPRLALPAFAAAALGASLVLGIAWELAMRVIYIQQVIDVHLLRAAMLPGFVLVAWSAMYVSFVYRDRANAEAERALRATALATEAELAMLRYQVNPHFLFNSLNSLRALIDEDPSRARSMVTELAELFRHALRTAREDLTAGDEIAAIRNYLEIQKIRFDEGLDAAIDVDEAAARTQLPGFLVHPLVENAVKYGLETSERPLRVRVRARREGGRLEVEVSNSGRWLTDGARNGAGTGTGLHNLRARLAHLYPGRHALEIGEADGMVRARLSIDLAPEGAR